VLGAALGHNFDQGLEGLSGNSGYYRGGGQHRIQAAFFTATFSVMGHICKADGQVSRDEIAAAKRVMEHMELNPDQIRAARALFNEGKKSSFPVDEVLHQLRQEIGHRLTLKRMFMEIQCVAASADGTVHPAEKRLLLHVCDVLGISHYELESLLASVIAAHHGAGPGHTQEDAYKVLGISRTATDGEVKKAYRRLMNQHHPDKLVSRGMPEEMVKLATERTREIRQAYETIKSIRGM
jgi:DnaJ like chaperone protein